MCQKERRQLRHILCVVLICAVRLMPMCHMFMAVQQSAYTINDFVNISKTLRHDPIFVSPAVDVGGRPGPCVVERRLVCAQGNPAQYGRFWRRREGGAGL